MQKGIRSWRYFCIVNIKIKIRPRKELYVIVLTFGLSDVFVVTVIARNRINGIGSLFFRDRILRFGENMPQSLKRIYR